MTLWVFGGGCVARPLDLLKHCFIHAQVEGELTEVFLACRMPC